MTSKPKSIIIISAPSGTGKTTLTSRLVQEHSDISFSISVTTRPQRNGEIDGQHYYFTDKEQFMKKVEAGNMLEWAQVFGNLYGTTKEELKRILSSGKRALLEIDVQGANSIRLYDPQSLDVFILPPSVESLWKRLALRGTDSLQVRLRRLSTAREEILAGKNFHHFIINDQLERAYGELRDLVVHGKPSSLSAKEGIQHCENLLIEFEKNNWNR